MLGNARERIGEPCLRVNAIEFGCHDQRINHGGALASAFGAGKQPSFAPDGGITQGSFSGVVGQTNPAVIGKAREGVLAHQHIMQRFSKRGLGRDAGPLLLHPHIEIIDKRLDPVLPRRAPLFGAQTVDGALKLKDRIDLFHRLQRDRRDDDARIARLGFEIGEH